MRRKAESKVSFVTKKVKADTYQVISDASKHVEDEFKGLYFTTEDTSKTILMPPIPIKTLCSLVSQNNILSQCVEAMEVNIDGTGYSFVAVNSDTPIDEVELARAENFFSEPFPGTSFIKIRRKLRRELESCGNGYLEVLRNAAKDIIAIRNIPVQFIRFVKLDSPVWVKKIFKRNGEDVEITMLDRERRFVHKSGNTTFYYKEFGVVRGLNRLTGEWVGEGGTLDEANLATELLVFDVNPGIETPYGLPRWINQMPSVLGSRKAEEQNLEFLDAGGLPSVMIIVQGGTLSAKVTEQLKLYLSGDSANKGVVIEAQPSSGSLDSVGRVDVKVERFGSEQIKDSMYSNYDKSTEDHVRVSFRLPSLFIGKSPDYNFATALTSYMVAEAQVFQPERDEFDDIINKTLMKGLGIQTLKFKSNPITLKNADNQIKILPLVASVVEADSLVKEINLLTGFNLVAKEGIDLPPIQPPNLQDETIKSEGVNTTELITLASDWAKIKGLTTTKFEFSEEFSQEVLQKVDNLSKADNEVFVQLVTNFVFGSESIDILNHQH